MTLGGFISKRRISTFSTLFPQYHLCPLCFELNHKPNSCFTTPRNIQCMESIPIPLTVSKLGSCNKGLGDLKPETYEIHAKNLNQTKARHYWWWYNFLYSDCIHIGINLKSSILHLNKIVFDEEMKNAENCVTGATSPFVYFQHM